MALSPLLKTLSARLARLMLTPLTALLLVGFVLLVAAHWSYWATFAALVPSSHIGFWLAMPVFLLSLLLLSLNLLALPFLVRPILIILLWIAAGSAYFMDTYGVMIDVEMIRNVVETDSREATELLTLKLFSYLLLIAALPSYVLCKARWQQQSILRNLMQRLLLAVFSVVALVISIAACYKDFSLLGREHKEIRMLINPAYPIYAFGQYLLTQHDDEIAIRTIADDAHSARKNADGIKPRVVVLVLGETARAAQFGLNGYSRNTSPELEKMDDIINFSNVWSCGTATATSLPCMFSNLGRDEFSVKQARSQESLLDVLDRAGVQVIWRDNNSGCKGTCDRTSFEDVEPLKDPRYCSTGECFDEILLETLSLRIAKTTSDIFIVLHQKGSHGPAYFRRTPESAKLFKPECTDVNVQNCDQQSIVNAYDNTIVYTDTILAKTIALLKAQNDKVATAMIYLSDHGESLGENGVYLHGFPYALAPTEQKLIPMIAWISPVFSADDKISTSCLKAKTQSELSHDNLFHSILGLFDVATTAYQAELDFFRSCKT